MTRVITAEPATAASRVLQLGTGTGQRATNRLTHGLDLDNILFDDGVGRQWLDGIMFDAIATAGLTELQQLDCGRTDVDADQAAPSWV